MGGYRIMGNFCGRDENGEFHCVCGKCERIQAIEERLDAIENLAKPTTAKIDLEETISQAMINVLKKKEGE